MKRVSKRELETLRNSGIFDEEYYLEQYPDVKMLGMDALEHYLWIGEKIGRHPSSQFSEKGNSHQRETKIIVNHARENIENDINCSTYDDSKKYEFAPLEYIESIAKRYLYNRRSDIKSKNIAFFSAITGGYDNVNFHEILNDFADYYMFCDAVEHKYIYNVKLPPYHDEDTVRSARFVKTHAHMLLPDYRIAVWADGNILIRGDFSELIRQFDRSGHPVAAIPHPLRTSVYDEALECIKRNKDDSVLIEAQMARYRSENFETADLIESNFMMFRINHPKLAPFLNAWWAEIERGSRRDQLSFNYAMNKAGASWFPLTDRPNSVRNHPDLALFRHGSNRCPHRPQIEVRQTPERNYSDELKERVRRQDHRRVDIVVCVHNALEAVKRCLGSVAATRNPIKHRIIIVNDGSNDVTSDWLKQFVASQINTRLIRHEQARGYTKAANAGLKLMNADMAILLNSDTIVGAHWIEKLLDAAFSNPGVGIVGPLSSAASHQSIPDHRSTANQTAVNGLPDGYSVADMNVWCEQNSPAEFLPRVPLVHGFCFGMTRDVVKQVGYFDEENFPSGYGEENDYCFRAVDAGFSLIVATHTYVYHEKSQSYQDERRISLAKSGNARIREIHGEQRVRRAIINMQENPHLQRLRREAALLFT